MPDFNGIPAYTRSAFAAACGACAASGGYSRPVVWRISGVSCQRGQLLVAGVGDAKGCNADLVLLLTGYLLYYDCVGSLPSIPLIHEGDFNP